MKRPIQRFAKRLLPALLASLFVILGALQTTQAQPSIETPTPITQSAPNKEGDRPLNLPKDKPDDLKRTPEEIKRHEQFLEADTLYKTGKIPEAVALYKVLKPAFKQTYEPAAAAITDPALLSVSGQVYWREAQDGIKADRPDQTAVALDLLSKANPEFLPGQLLQVETYRKANQPEKALALLNNLSARYPQDPDLLKTRITALGQAQNWIDASLAARQFALVNPTHPRAPEFAKLADENLTSYRRALRRKLTGNTIGNVITGALGYALTGGLLGPLTAIQSSAVLLQGESALGDRITKQAKKSLTLVDDKETNEYVTEIGMKLAKIAGREDFKYEFYIVRDENLNAFALPGGKVFINAGAIAKTTSESELAGLLGHEISHAVLGHSLQLMSRGNLTASITQYIPYVGGIAEGVIVSSYSRDMERQSDALGTRLIASAGYAPDGVWNLMQNLEKEEKAKDRAAPPSWISSHPAGKERLANIETLIVQSGYDRNTFEGVDRHDKFRRKMNILIQEDLKKKEKIKDNRPDSNPEPTPSPTLSPTPTPSPTIQPTIPPSTP
jgi:predicted Zn-dependent protease